MFGTNNCVIAPLPIRFVRAMRQGRIGGEGDLLSHHQIGKNHSVESRPYETWLCSPGVAVTVACVFSEINPSPPQSLLAVLHHKAVSGILANQFRISSTRPMPNLDKTSHPR